MTQHTDISPAILRSLQDMADKNGISLEQVIDNYRLRIAADDAQFEAAIDRVFGANDELLKRLAK